MALRVSKKDWYTGGFMFGIARVVPRLFLLLALTTAAHSRGQEPERPSPPPPFSENEKFEYDVEWRLLTAGRATLDSRPSKTSRQSKLHLESTGVVSRLFRVNDDYTADMSIEFCATQTYMTAREGNRTRDTKIVFDQSAKKARYEEKDLKTNGVVKHEIDTPGCVQDIIGALYKLRAMNLEPGKNATIPVSNGKKAAMLRIEGQRREEVKTPAGVKKAIRYEVFAFDNQLYTRSGHLHVWLSDDARRTPVQIQIRLQFTIGTITLKLNKETVT